MARTMRALITNAKTGPSVQDVPVPTPEAGEIVVKVHYIAQNPTDWKSMATSTGNVLGCDFAGTVEEPNGSQWRQGQRVAGFVQGNSNRPPRGVFAEYCVIEGSLVFPIPDEVSFQDAAAIPLPFATAMQAMFQRLALPEPSKPDKTALPFLVNGGTSSVGQYAIQLAKLAGLFVVATGSKKNHELLRSLGADETVDYKDADWPEQVRELTHDGLQHALDTISEKGTVQATAKALSTTKGGHVVTLLSVYDIRKSEEVENPKAKLESTIVYTVFERPIKYGTFDNCGADKPTPEDKATWEKYLSSLPEWLRSGKIKANKVREYGGLDDVVKGFQDQKDGKLSAEKLVYRIV
jgi:NADPH:quinone reductase-like Zn-dependent oxidoreductase